MEKEGSSERSDERRTGFGRKGIGNGNKKYQELEEAGTELEKGTERKVGLERKE